MTSPLWPYCRFTLRGSSSEVDHHSNPRVGAREKGKVEAKKEKEKKEKEEKKEENEEEKKEEEEEE